MVQRTGGQVGQAVEVLLDASRALVGITARALADADDVTLPQWRALVLVDRRERTTVSDLAEALGVHPTTATRLCDRLVAKQLVERHASEVDRRQVLLGISPRGRRMVARVDDRRRAGLAGVVEHLDPDQRHLVIEAMAAFTAAVERGPAGSAEVVA